MAQTDMMRADEIVVAFNGVNERRYWKASIAGSRTAAEVHFNSRATMVRVVYRIATGDFTVMFTKSSATFGDFLASAYRSVAQVLAGLKAGGLPFAAPDDTARPVLRLEYDPHSKEITAYVARSGDAWLDADPAPFKVPERNNSGNPAGFSFAGLDDL